MKEKKKSNIYLCKHEFYKEVKKWQELGGTFTAENSHVVGEMVDLLVDRFATKGSHNRWSNLEELKGDAKLMVLRKLHKFDPDKSKEAFSFFTTVIYRVFLQGFNKAKKYANMVKEHTDNKRLEYLNTHDEVYLNDEYQKNIDEINWQN